MLFKDSLGKCDLGMIRSSRPAGLGLPRAGRWPVPRRRSWSRSVPAEPDGPRPSPRRWVLRWFGGAPCIYSMWRVQDLCPNKLSPVAPPAVASPSPESQSRVPVPSPKSRVLGLGRGPSGSAGTLRGHDLRLGTCHRPALGRPRPAGRLDRSIPRSHLPRESLKSKMKDHGSER